MDLKEFVFEYGWIILCLGGLAAYFVWIWRKRGKSEAITQMKATAYQLMLAAEKQFVDEDGQFKFAWVIKKMYGYMPKTIKAVFSEDQFKKFLQHVYDEMKDLVDDEDEDPEDDS